MERRKFVVGLGALAAGSSAALGTGAFSQATVPDREITVQVADTDEEGAVGLSPGNTNVADFDESGNLYIDLNKGLDHGGNGMNPNSTYHLGGEFRTPAEFPATPGQDEFDRPLFELTNQSNETRRVTCRLEWIDGPSDAEISGLSWHADGDEENVRTVSVDANDTSDNTAMDDVEPGDKLPFIMVVESGSEEGEIEAQMTFGAGAQR